MLTEPIKILTGRPASQLLLRPAVEERIKGGLNRTPTYGSSQNFDRTSQNVDPDKGKQNPIRSSLPTAGHAAAGH